MPVIHAYKGCGTNVIVFLGTIMGAVGLLLLITGGNNIIFGILIIAAVIAMMVFGLK